VLTKIKSSFEKELLQKSNVILDSENLGKEAKIFFFVQLTKISNGRPCGCVLEMKGKRGGRTPIGVILKSKWDSNWMPYQGYLPIK